MESNTRPAVVGVRFSKVGKIYHFSASTEMDIKVGDQVVVETSRGWQLGQVAQVLGQTEPPPEGWKSIDRRATPRDLLLRQMWQMKEAEVVSSCRARAAELRLSGIKIVSAEYSFDGTRLTILFSTETEEKYDLKSLRQDMQKLYGPSQVEMRQIGPRDMAKVTCGMGACGLETRCCCLFLTEFSSISIRMAKEQGISLTPSEITGMCGRLRCCLIYEYDTYVEARAKLPKRNKQVRTPQGEGKVVDVVPLRGSVVVEIPEFGRREFAYEELTLADDDESPGSGVVHDRGARQVPEDEQINERSEKPVELSNQDNIPGRLDALASDAKKESQKEMPQGRPARPQHRDRIRREGPGGRRSTDRGPSGQGRPKESGLRTSSDPASEQHSASEHATDVLKKNKDRKPTQIPGGSENKPKTQPTAGSPQPRRGRDNRRRGQRRDGQSREN